MENILTQSAVILAYFIWRINYYFKHGEDPSSDTHKIASFLMNADVIIYSILYVMIFMAKPVEWYGYVLYLASIGVYFVYLLRKRIK